MGKKRNKVEIFKLEDRVLFEAGAVVQAAEAAAADQANNDAAGDGSAAAEMQSDNNQTASDELTPDNLAEMPVPPEMSGSDNADDTADADAADFAAADPESDADAIAFTDAPIASSETSERILVVLNSSVADADSIVNDLGDNVEVLRLTSGTDALDTINDYLDEHADTKYSAIHLVSHGSEGYITLNGEKIDSTTINPADWKAIGEHLTDDADILVYGCDTAKSDEGKALVQTIANLTGADVAASIDSTGATGDWDLEYRSGLIEAATLTPQYSGRLATEITVTIDGVNDFTDLQTAITDVEAGGTIKFAVDTANFAKNMDTNGDGTLDSYGIDITATLAISKNITINGWIDFDSDGVVDQGERIVFDGGDKFGQTVDGTEVTTHSGVQILNVKSGATVAIDGIQFQHAYSTANGGVISNAGTVTVSNSVFFSNSTTKYGVLLYNASTGVAVIDSSYAKNNATTGGGAVYNAGGVLALMNSTITGTTGAEYVIYDAFGNNNSRTYVIGSTIFGNSIKGARLYNSLIINSIMAANGGQDLNSPGSVTSYVLNSFYTSTNGYPKLIGSTKVTATADASTLMQLFGSDNPELSADGTLTPLLEAVEGKKALQLRVKDTTVETDDGAGNITTSIRKDLQYHNGGTDADEDKNWTTIQAGTKITDEILARMDHDQLGHSRGTKTVGAVSLAEDPSIHTLVVNTTNGADAYDNLTSIEEAVAYANTLEGEQTITFAEGLAFNHDADGNGTADSYLININKTMALTKAGLVLTIDGADKLILDGGDKYDGTTVTTHSGVQIFTVAADTTLNLSNTTLQNGYLLNGKGAAIHNSGTLSITDSTIADNWIDASKNTSYGVGIYNAASGKLTLTNVNFYDNMGKSTVDETNYVCGGGIANYGTLAITGGVFDGNQSTNNGAGVFNAAGASLTINGTVFTNNKTTGSAGAGGAIWSAGTMTLTNGSFTGNHGRYGAVHLDNGSNAFIDRTLFNANTGDSNDALYMTGTTKTVVMNSTFYGHTKSGAIYLHASGSASGEATFINTTIVNNTLAYSAARYGNSTMKLTFINSFVADSFYVPFDGVEVEYINSIYTNATGKNSSGAKVDFNTEAGINHSTIATTNEIFGAAPPTLSANGTVIPAPTATYEAAVKGASLLLKVEPVTVDESTTRNDLMASADGGKTWTTVQEGTTLTNEQLANQDHDQLGNSRGTKTIGAVSLPETVQSLVVNTTNGADAYDNLTSIEEAIAYANTLEGEQTITFAEGLAFNHDADGNGTADSYLININKTMALTKAGLVLTIDGADKLILDGGDKYDGTTVTEHSGYQIMTVAKNVTVNLSNLTLQNGYYLGKEGGAAILNKGTVTLNNVDVLSNFAQANGGHLHGGAIYNAGTMNIADSYFADNTGTKAATANYNFFGGAVYNKSGATLNVSGTTFENNEAIWGGGAIENNGTLNVSDSVFNENIGSSDKGTGGAIVSSGGSATLTVSKSTFTGNIGRFGGAISVESGSKAFIVDSYFDGNKGGRGGGAVYSYQGTFTVMNSTFTNHSSGVLGLFTQSSGTASALVINSTFYGNTGDITTTTANETFIVVNSISTSTIKAFSGATIKLFNSIYNTTSGTIDVSSGDNTILTGNEVFGSNTVQADGTISPVHTAALGKLAELSINADGDLVYGSTVVQTATTITNEQLANQTHDQNGNSRGTKTIGAVSAKENLTSLVVNTTNGADAYDNLTSIEEAVAYANTLTGTQTVTFAQDLVFNYDADGNGENDSYLINLNKSMTVNKSGLTLTIDGAIGENKVTLDAGGKSRHFNFSNAVITLQNMTLQNAYAKDTNGGSISNANTSTLTIDNVSFLNNELERTAGAYGKGGAIYSNGKLTVRNSEFIGNRSYGSNFTVQGGAIYVDSSATIIDTIFDSNTSYQNGGAIATDNTVNISGSIFKNNKVTNQYGGAVSGPAAGAKITIDSSYFEGNQSSRGSAVFVDQGTLMLLNSTFTGNIGKEGAVSVFGAGGYTLIAGSTFVGNKATSGSIIDVYIRRDNEVDLVNCIMSDVLYNYSSNTELTVYNSVYNTIGGYNNASKNAITFVNSTQSTAADVFGSNTVQADGTIMPVLDAALGGAAMLKVVPTQVDETTTRQDLQISLDGGKNWTTLQEGTKATTEQVTHDQLGNGRGTKTIGAVSAKETASLTVNSTGSAIDAYDGVITLNEAIAYAAADAAAVKGGAASAFAGAGFADNQYTINFADTITQITVDSTIRLEKGAFQSHGLVIDGTRTDGGKVILDGGATVTFNADGTFASHDGNGVRILHISENNNITLNNLIFQNAYSSTAGSAAGAGGAVYFEKGGTLCVNDSIFRKNAVNDQGGRGGAAIAAVGGTLLIDNSLFEQNVSIRAASGSAILTVTTTTITNSTIRSNYNAGSTGTIMTQGNTLNLINTTITGNYGTDNTAIQSYWTAKTTINLINSTVTGNIASSATAKGVIGYNATPENTYTVLNVINSIVAGNTGGDIALGSRSGSALNVINSIYGTINTTVANTPVNSVAETDLSQIFEMVSDGKAVATTQTVNGVMHDVFALKKDGIAAQNGALVGKLNGAYYYMDNGKWFALDGTEKAAFAQDADTGYGLGADATIYSTAQNVDNAKTPVDRLYALKAENAEIIQIGAYAFNFIPNSEAKSLVVNLADDVVNGSDEKTSLREALSYAASLGGTQTITFDSTVFGDGATIVLDSAKGEIELTSNITIDGDVNADGKADVTIDGNNATRIFLINSEIAVTLQNLNLINGNVADIGAGIHLNNSNAVLTIDNVLFEGNAASGTQKSGGAIGVSRGTIVISDSVFRNNSATGSGAAIALTIGGDLTVTNTLFDGNTSSYHGATIYGAGYSNIYLNSITVMNSIGRGAYGAAVLLQGSSVIANSTFINNSATQASAAASTIELRGGHTQIFGSTFYTELVPSNQAAQIAVSETATLDLVNSVVASVSGTEAFKVADTATLNLYGVKYTGTQAAVAGSTLIADADLGKHFTLVDGKVAIATKTVNGVTHSCLMPLNNTGGATVTLTDSGSDSAPDMITIAQDGVSTAVIELVRNDLAADVFTKDQFGRERGTAKTAGSVIYTVEDPSLVVNTTLDVSNAYDGLTSLREAIAYLNQNGTLNGENTITFAESLSGETITLSSTIGNITKSMTINGDIDGDGTADVTVDADQKGYFFDLTTADMEFTLNGLILTNSNYTAGANGGAINLKANGITLNVIDSRIENSTNTRNGATIFIEKTGAEVNIIDSVFNGNTSTWTGAVVFVSSVADFELNVSGSTISNNIIKGTTTHSDGGAIFVSGVTNAKVTITDSVFENNKGTGANGDAGISGGAFAYYNTSTTAHAEITITGSQFTGNRGASGGALSLVGKMTALLDDNTFTDNSSRAAGGAIYHGGYQADVTISNSIFTGNHADGTDRTNHGGGAIFISSMDKSAVTTSVQILNNTFTGNSATAAGGALAVRRKFHSGGSNGGISFGDSSTTFLIHGENLTFKDNSAEYGGALLLHADMKSYIEFTNSLFDGNTATKTGGAIHLTATYNAQGFTANFHGLTIINNSAGYSGGAIAIAERADLYLSDSTVVGNRLTTTGKTIGDEDTSSTETAYFGGAGIYKGQAYRLDNNNGPGQDVFLIHNIIADNTLESNGSIVAHDIYSRNGVLNSVANIYSVGAGVTKIGGMDYVDADYAALASALFAPKVADKYVVDSNGLLQVNELTDEALNTAVNRNGFQLGTYQSGTYGQLICYSVDGGLSWNDAKGVAYTGELLNIYMADQTGGARVPYSTAGAAQYKPALMWSKADDGTITHWSTIADAKTQLESGSGEYFFAPTMQDFGDVAVNGSLILHGYNPDSGLKINLILDSATDAVTVNGMKFTGEATLTAGSMTIENALLTGEGDFAVTNGVLTILNSTVYNFGGTITIDAANGIGQIVNSTLYGNSGTITGNDRLNILNSLVFGTENLSGYTAKYSVFDGTGTAATNTYSASADDVFGTELVWDGLILTALQATPNSTAPHVNGTYVAVNGTNLYYSTDKVNWKNFADDSAATVDDAYIIKTDGLGNTRVVINGKAVAGAYSSLKEAGSLTVTIAADIVDPYDELISLREAIQYLKDGYRDANGETVITFDLDAIKAATGKYAYRTLTDGSIRIDVTSLEEGSSDTAFNVASGVSYTIDGQDTGLIIDISLLGKNRRLFYVNGGTLTLKNITLYGSGSNDSTGELDLGSSTRYDNISGSIICVNAGNLNADHVTFARSNHSIFGNNNNGGAALWLTSGVATVTNSTFRDNYGISVKVRGNGKHVLDGITFTGNTGANDHGLIEHHDNGANVTYRNFTITGNKIPHVFYSHRGEPIYASNFVIYDNTFTSSVFRCHGAASLYNMTVTDNNITGSVFQFDHGTGASITQEVYNSTVAGNYGNISAIVNITGANEGSVVAVFDNTFAGNVSTNTAFASVYSASSVTKSIFIANNIFANDAVMDGVGEAGKTYYGTAYDINVAAPKTYLFHNITGGKYSDAMTVTIDASNVTGTYAELFGAQTPVLDVENGVHTLVINKDGAASDGGVLVGKIGSAYYFVRDGVWHKADGTVYQIDDGTGTMVDVALTNDAATNYGLGTKSGTVVYTTAQNTDSTTGSPDRLLGAEWSVFNVGSHQLGLETGDIVVTNAADYINPFGGGITLREAVELYSKSGDTITFADNVTEIQLKEQILIIHALSINGAITVNGEDARVHIKAAATDRAFKLNNRLGKDNGNGGISAGDAEYALFDVTLTNLEITGGDITKKGEVRSTEHFLANMGATILAFQTNLTITNSILNGGNGGSGNVLYIDKVNGTSLTFDGVTVNGGTGNSAITAYSAYQSYINSQFLNNSGGSALVLGYHSDYVYIEKSLFSGNSGAAHGGAIAGGSLMIKDSTFINNTARQNGGALSVNRVLAENVSFINNAAGNSTATDVKSKGGAIKLETADSVFVNCTIAGNISYGNNTDAADGYSAGAICFEPGSKGKTLTLINTTVTDNTGVHVGGINMCGNNLVLINSIVAGNHTTGADSIGTDIRSELGTRKDGLPDLGTVTAYNSVSSYVFAGATPGQLDANGNFVLDDSTRALFQLDSNGKVVLQDNGLGKYTTVMADHTLVENMQSKYITLYHDANGVLTGAGYSDTADGAVTMAFGKNNGTASPLTTDQNGTAYAGLYTTVGSVEVAYVEPASTVVTTLDDTVAADNETSLREAIAVAGKDYYSFGKSLKGGATITFSTDVDWSKTNKTIILSSQLSIATAGVVIDGALKYGDTDQGIITIKVPVTYAESLADNTKTVSDFRVFSITANATLNNMILKGGKVDNGGVIYTSAYLTMDSVMVSEGAATNRGGGIYSAGSGMYAQKVTIYNNADLTNGYEKGGGGLTLAKNGALNVLVNSTIVGNTSASKHSNGGGSAILVYQGRLMLVSCTVTGNTDTGSGMCAIKQTSTGGREIFLLDSIVAGNNSSYDIDLSRTSATVRIANSIYGKTNGSTNTQIYNSKQFTDGTQVFGATPELLTDENGLVYIRPTAEAAGNGGREYKAITFYSRDWHASMTFGYFDEDGYLCSYDGARLAYSGAMDNNDMTYRTFYTTTDGGETFTMLNNGSTVKFANETASTLRLCMLPKANSTYAFSDLRANIQKSLCWITRDGFEVVDPSLGGVGNLLDTSYTKVSTMMKVDGQPATQAYQDLFNNAATYLRGGEPRKAVIGAALPQAEVKTGTVNTDLDVVDVYDGLISLREATGDYTADGDTITFADALTEIKLDSGLTISKNLTFTDDNMKISGAALTVADAVSLTISTGSKFEFTEGVVNNGTLANNGTLTIPSLTGTGTLANNGTLSVAGAVAQAVVTNNGAAEIGGNLETTGAVTNGTGAELTVTGTFTAASLDNSGMVTANSAYSVAGTSDNKSGATLKTEGAFNGGTVNNAGNIDANSDFVVTTLVNTAGQVNLAGETITVTDLAASTLGNVTYDGATAQQIITGTYAALILSGAGTKTATGNITANSVKNETETKVTGDLAVSGAVESSKSLTVGGNYSATSTTNSSDLKVTGNFAGGAVDNTGAMTLSGATNTADAGSTLGDVTYDGAGDQAIIAGDYGDLTINSTGKATATGDITAHGNITTSSETEVTGNVFADGDLESTGALTVGGDAIALQNMTLSGDTDVAGNLRVHYGDLESTGDLTVGGYVETLYGDVSLSGDTDVMGNLTAAGTLDNDAALTVGGNFTAVTTDNSATLDVNGNFAGGTVNNTGSMTLAGATNSGTGTLGDVTYDGTANQQVIASETYGDLVISTTGTATVNGNLKAETTTNSATLDVNGNFAGGTVTNTGSMTLAGASNSGTGTLGNVTYDGADQQVIAGTYGDLTINSTGKASATGNISAAAVDNNANTEVTGNLTTTGDLESTAALKIGGSVESANITTTGEMEVAGNLTATGTVDSDAALTVGGNLSAATTDNSSDLKVSGNYTANTTTTSGTLDVDGNFSGGAVNNTGAMTLSGASNSATGTLGDVTYDGTADQEVIAGTYEDLVISTTGKATVNGDVSAATVKNDAETAITGDLTTTGDLASTAALTVGGNASANNATLSGDTAITGNLTATGNITSNGDMDVTGDLTATGDLASTAALTVGGNTTANNATLSGDTAITGDLTATGTVDFDAALTVGGDFTADTADNSSDLTVGGNFSATTTNNSGTLDAAGDLDAGALTNSGSISVAGVFATTSTDLGAVEYDGTAAQNVVEGTYSDLSLTGGDKALAGAVTVTDSLTADANIDTAGQDLTISGDVAGTGTISTTTDSGTVTYDGADQNILAGAYNNLALANGTKTLNSTNTTTVNDTFSANNTTIQSDAADVLASLTVKDAGNDNAPSSAIAGTNFNGIALNNTGSADGYLYVNADTNNADDTTTGVYLVGNVFVAANGIIYGDTLGEVYITVTNGNGDVISEGTADDLGWTWAVGNDAIENATTGTAYELVSKEGFKFRFHGDVDVVIGKRAITVKADDLEIDTGDDPVFTYTYVGELVGTDTFTGELASEGDGSKPGDFEITQGTLTLGDNYNITFIGGVLTVEGGGQDAHQFPNYNNPGNFAGVYDAAVHSTIHSYDHHESVPTLEHQNDRSIGFLFSVSNKQLGDASGAFGDNAPQGADVDIHAHTLSDLLKSYDKSEQIIASPANEIQDAQDDMKDLHDFSNNPFGILPDDEDLHTRAYDESIDFTVIGEDNLSTAKAEQFKDEFDAALEEILSLA